MQRIPTLDGVRALACIAVILYHTYMPFTQAGWLGVDVFFVLSGYLITTLLILERVRTGRIRLGAFYLRRAARLYPALVVACGIAVVAYLCGVASLPGDEKPSVAVIVALTYTAESWRASGRNGGIMGHAWSLAVEEQFSLLWPPVVLLVRRTAWIGVTAAVLASASVSTMILMPGPHGLSDFSYSSPQARAWELILGCIVAVSPKLTRGGAAVSLAAASRPQFP